jgi:hypothetical protein
MTSWRGRLKCPAAVEGTDPIPVQTQKWIQFRYKLKNGSNSRYTRTNWVGALHPAEYRKALSVHFVTFHPQRLKFPAEFQGKDLIPAQIQGTDPNPGAQRHTWVGALRATAKPHPTLSVGWAGFRSKRAPIPMESNITDG